MSATVSEISTAPLVTTASNRAPVREVSPLQAPVHRARDWRSLRRGLTIPGLLLFAWWAAYAFGLTQSRFYTPPGQVLSTLWTLLPTALLWEGIAYSLGRAVAGLALGSVAGIGLGVLVGVSPLARRLLGTSLNTLRQVSLFAWVPLIIIWFGLDELSKVVFVAIAAFFPVLLNTYEGVAGISRQLSDVGRVLVFNRWQMFFRMVVPGALPSIFNGIYTALVRVWGAVIAAEYLMTSGPGIGRLILDGQETSAMDLILVGVLLAGVIGYGLHTLASRLEARLLCWRPGQPGQRR